jgi:uncharacterized protein
MNCISLNNGEHQFCCEHNVIIASELMDHFLEHGESKKIELNEINITKELLENKVRNINQISFEVTQACSLNCTYCVYGGAYDFQRSHSRKKMEFDTARKAIDCLYEQIKFREKDRLQAVSFYGGEPLLNTDLMKQVVDYSKEVFTGWDVRFFITTNLTVLDDEMIRFLVENRFHVTVSLDGPKDVHDNQRVFPNGEGSHDVVMKNLQRIKDYDEDFFLKEVNFNCVYSQEQSIRKVYDFFAENPLVNKNVVRLNSVDPRDSHYYEDVHIDGERLKEEYREILDIIREKSAENRDLLPIEKNMLGRYNILDDVLAIRRASHLAGTCLFDSKLFTDVNGNFHACEKINDKFPIGNVHDGFQYDKMKKVADDFSGIIKEECKGCRFQVICSRCYVCFAKDGEFRFDQQFCRERKRALKRNLENYVALKSEGVI